MKNKNQIPGEIPKSIIRATASILEPLIYLLLNFGVSFQALQELLKATYIKVAEDKFTLERKKQTDSRISMLTGVHRRDVKRLRLNQEDIESAVAQRVRLGSQIVALWVSDPLYLDTNGKPKPLPRFASEETDITFEALVAKFSQDIRARVLLDEWLNLGAVHLDKNDQVHLNVDAFVPNEGLDEKAFFLATNVRDHLAATAHNIIGTDTSFLERSLQYNELSKESIAELTKMAEELSMKSLLALNRRAIELEESDKNKPQSSYRINFGVYCYHDKDEISWHKGN